LRRAARCLRTPLGLALALTLVFWLVSAVASIDPARSLEKWVRVVVFTGGATLLWARLSSRPEVLRQALKALVVAALAVGLFAVAALYIWPGLLAPLRTGPIETTYDVGQALSAYGSVVPCMAPVVLWAGFALERHWRTAALLYLPVVAALVYGTGSKAGLLGLGAAVLAVAVVRLLVTFPQTAARVFGVGLFAFGVIAIYAVGTRLPAPPYWCETLSLPTAFIDAHRQVIWAFALEKGLEAPWFGHGIDTVSSLPGAGILIPCIDQEYIPSHPHNWILELFAETGAFGLAAASAALLLLVRGLIRDAARRHPAAWAAIGLYGAFWGSALVNFSIWAAWWQGTLLVLTAMTLAAVRPERA
jgi:O-antigen ligase